jgi:hypothetical protein
MFIFTALCLFYNFFRIHALSYSLVYIYNYTHNAPFIIFCVHFLYLLKHTVALFNTVVVIVFMVIYKAENCDI